MKCTFSLWWILIVGIIVLVVTQTKLLKLSESFYYQVSSPSIGVTNIVTTDSDGNLSSFPFPKGIVVMWSGDLTAIPNGWSLCDGTNGAPDLRGRFVIGSNPSDSRTSDQDEANQTLEPRPHKSKGGEQKHKLTINEMPRHSHNSLRLIWGGGSWDNVGPYNSSGNNATYIPTTSTGGPSGSTTEGASDAHNNIPPYYALAYIMKL